MKQKYKEGKRCLHYACDSSMDAVLDQAKLIGISKGKMVMGALRMGREYDPSIALGDAIVRRAWIDAHFADSAEQQAELCGVSIQEYNGNIIKKFLLCEGAALLEAFAPFLH
jgi:hypothetical protein